MTLIEFKDKLKRQIERLSDDERRQFALDICKRLFPDYEAFYRKHKWGNLNNLKKGIKLCEQIKLDSNVNIDQLEELRKSIEEGTPDTENYGDWDGSYALNAAAAIIETLAFVQDKNIAHVLNVSELMTDTVDFKISQNFGNLSPEALDAHTWMIDERNRQIDLTK